MRRYVFTIALLVVTGLAYGQKANVRKARTEVDKENPNFNEALSAIKAAMNDATTMNDPETYDVAGKIYRKMYEIEGMKAYKKEAYDTVKLYNSVLEMFKYYELCDEKAQIPDEKGKLPRNKWREPNQKDMMSFHGQLFDAGAAFYLMRKRDYKQAINYLGAYLESAESPMLKEKNLLTDSAIIQTSFYIAYAAYSNNDNENVIKYGRVAIDSPNPEDSETAFQILTHAYKEVGDSISWINMLQEGVKRNPASEGNIVQLINYYNDKGKSDEAMKFADQLVEQDPDNDYSYFIKGVLVQQGLKEPGNAIQYYKKALEIAPNKAEYYSNLGTCYIAVAQELDEKSQFNSPDYKEQQKIVMQNYMWAHEAFEKVRELAPAKEDIWLAPLYRIKYKLGINQGEDFQELQKKMDVREQN